MSRPAISDTSGAKAKVICMVASLYWYLMLFGRTALVCLHVCTRDTIAQASRVCCDILAANIGIVRKACVVPSDEALLLVFPSGAVRVGCVFSPPLHDLRKIPIHFARMSQMVRDASAIVVIMHT
jgi:hypothetical protein